MGANGSGIFCKAAKPTKLFVSLSLSLTGPKKQQPARLYEHVATFDPEESRQADPESRRTRKRDRALRWWQDAKTTLGLRIFSLLTALSGIALFMSESKTIMAAVDEAVKLVVAEFHDPSHWSANITGRILTANLINIVEKLKALNVTDLAP